MPTYTVAGGAIINGELMTANRTSEVLDVSDAGVVGLHFVAASATHVGSFAVQLSIDGSTWDPTSFRLSDGSSASSVAAANGSAVAELVTVDVGQARRLRVVYTFTSGTGTAYVYAIAKNLAALANISATLVAGDLQIGAVEIKDATTSARAVVGAASSAGSATVGLAVADGNLHDSLGAVGAAADPDGVLHGQLRSIAENTDTLPTALGPAVAASAMPVTPGGAATGTTTSVGDSATSVTLLSANANRRGASIFNDSSAILYVKLGATASVTSFVARLVQYATYEVLRDYTGIIDGIWASDAGGNARITEIE
jgi:hypothetical protein